MNLIDYSFIGFNIKLIRDILNQNNLIVSFAFILMGSIPPMSFAFLYQLKLYRIIGHLFTSYLKIDCVINLHIIVSDGISEIRYLFAIYIFNPRIFLIALNEYSS